MVVSSFKHRQSERGVTIIEALIGIFLVGVVAITIIGLATLGTRLSIEGERQTVAQAIVNDRIEYIRSLDYDDVGYIDAQGDEPDGTVVRSETITRNQQQYDVMVTVDLIDSSDNGGLPPGGLIEVNSDYKHVTVNAEWTSAGGNQRNVLVTTYITAGGNVHSCTPGQSSCPGGAICPANGVCPPTDPIASCPSEAYFCGGGVTSPTYLTTINQLFVEIPGDDPGFIGEYTGSVFDAGGGMLDIAVASDGTLYGITDNAAEPNRPTELHVINTSTGQLTSVGNVDTTSNTIYTSAEFLSDGRLAIGGPQRMKFITLTNGSISNIETLDLTYSDGSVYFSGDLVERSSGNIWFIGHDPDNFTGSYCYEANPTTGTVTWIQGPTLGDSAWGAVCEDSACNTINVYTGAGFKKWIDASTCSPVAPSYNLHQEWEGASG